MPEEPIAEVRSPPSTVWITSVASCLLAFGFGGLALWAEIAEPNTIAWLNWSIALAAAVFAAWSSLSVRLWRTRLYPTFIERRDIIRVRRMNRADVGAYRIQRTAFVRLVHREKAGRGLSVTQEVLMDPQWRSWLESLPRTEEAEPKQQARWLQKTPVAFRLALFFVCIAMATVAARLLARLVFASSDELFSWADLRYFAAMWAICSAVYYFGWAMWRLTRKP